MFIKVNKAIKVVFIFITRSAPITGEKRARREGMGREKGRVKEFVIGIHFSNEIERGVKKGDIISFGKTPLRDTENGVNFDTRVTDIGFRKVLMNGVIAAIINNDYFGNLIGE